MILDQELSQLSQPETGVIGSIGFTAAGGFIGLFPASLAGLEKVEKGQILSVGELASVAACTGSFALAGACLVIFGLARWRNRDLASSIRTRHRQNFRQATPTERSPS